MEVLITTMILTIVAGALFAIFYQSQYSFSAQRKTAETTQQLRIAMDQIVRTLRQAGSDPEKSIDAPAVQSPSQGSILISADLTGSEASSTGDSRETTGDPDGTLDSIYEQVLIRHDTASRRVLIDVGYGEEVLAENIEALEFIYFDASGATVTDPGSAVRVRVTLAGETPTDLQTGKAYPVTLSSDVFLRSRAFQIFE